MQYVTNLFGQTYGGCSYGGLSYDNSSCQGSSGTGTGTTTGGGSTGGTSGTGASGTGGSVLTNTGFDILVIVTLACTIAFIAFVVRLWRKPKKQVPPDGPPTPPVS